MTRPAKEPKYEVNKTGPGSLRGAKFTSLTEAMAYARHILDYENEVRITKLKRGER